MLNIKNNSNAIKRDILVRLLKLQLAKKLDTPLVNAIPMEVIPKDSVPFSCCIYHDRHLIKMRALARMGFSVEDYDETKNLSDYAREALGRKELTFPMLTILEEACNACVKQDFVVTNACQGCFARPCSMNCPKKAIDVKHHAHIDPEKCIHCGLCEKNCPYHAIIKITVPCEASCPVGAISKASDGHEVIDWHKCIYCGNCMRECPFGAMMDKSQAVDVVARIMSGQKVVAMYAPAIASQFKVTHHQLEKGIKEAGFSEVLEVALGADICATNEAREFEERMEQGEPLMTTSCCPSYVRAVRRHVKALEPCISETRSPMYYTGEMARKLFPGAVTVFIGPCLSKKREGMDLDVIDYVLTVEELDALFMAMDIVLANIAADDKAKVSATDELGLSAARARASGIEGISGGVAKDERARGEELSSKAVSNEVNKSDATKEKATGESGSEGKASDTSATASSEKDGAIGESAASAGGNKAEGDNLIGGSGNIVGSPSKTGRGFAMSGGVAEAVKVRLDNPQALKAEAIDGLDKAGMARLKYFGDIYTGKVTKTSDTPNLVEVMCCKGGCIAGPCVITNPQTAGVLLKRYVEDANGEK